MMNAIVSCTEGQDLVIYVNPDYDELRIRAKFYTFAQNNSGGSFVYNENLSEWVIIEAYNYQAANDIAERHGIYFNGVGFGPDCPCCGDRWSEQRDEDASTFEPEVFGIPAFDRVSWHTGAPEPIVIHYLDGRRVKAGQKKIPAPDKFHRLN
jgi:hypothetical protein